MSRYAIGIDIGGHKTNVGLFKESKLIKSVTFPTPHKKKEALGKIFKVITSFNVEIGGIGIGVPGQVEGNVIIKLTNLKGWENTYIATLFRKKFGDINFALLNDADAAVIAEQNYWKKNNIICITLGTGLGSGVILDGKLLRGVEIGHMCISFEGLKCSCGARGCLEEYISARAIERMARIAFKKKLDPLAVEKLARQGNKKALKIYYTAGRYLGVGLRNVANIFQPDLIVLAGGMSNAADLIMPGVEKSMEKAIYNSKVIKTRLNKNSGIIGAVLKISSH